RLQAAAVSECSSVPLQHEAVSPPCVLGLSASGADCVVGERLALQLGPGIGAANADDRYTSFGKFFFPRQQRHHTVAAPAQTVECDDTRHAKRGCRADVDGCAAKG